MKDFLIKYKTLMKEFLIKHKTKIKIASSLTAASLALVIIVSSALAFFKFEVEDDAVVTTMKTDIILYQRPDTTEGLKYVIQPSSENTDYIYVRLVIFPIIEIQDEPGSSTYHAYAGIPSSNIEYKVTGDNWFDYDGYYYYQYQIDSGVNSVRQYTDDIVISEIQLNTTSYDDGSMEWFDLPTSIDNKNIRIRFYVSAEAVQAKNNAYQLSWDLSENEFKNIIGIQDLNKIYDASDGITKSGK